jgi:hypothetical protein
LRAGWVPKATLRFDGRHSGLAGCRLELAGAAALHWRVWKKTEGWTARLGGDGDDLCLTKVTFVFADDTAFTWEQTVERVWTTNNTYEVAAAERGQFQALTRVTATVCSGWVQLLDWVHLPLRYTYLDPGTRHPVRLALETMAGEHACTTAALKGSRSILVVCMV